MIDQSTHIHIGHHFFGAGNLGDDLMMAGFYAAFRSLVDSGQIKFSCPILFDRQSQRGRFPQIAWLPYEPLDRERSIMACDAWVGVGDTPFQTTSGPWLLDHLVEEATWCRRYGKPMYFIGVGVNDLAALEQPQTPIILDAATHIWTRDPLSAELLAGRSGPDKVTVGADLANIWLAEQHFGSPEAGTLGYLLNFEDIRMLNQDAIAQVTARLPNLRHRWLVQEVRELPGSERVNYAALSAAWQARVALALPDYQAPSPEALLQAWGVPETFISSRYHGGLIAAWMGSKLVLVQRSDKLRGLAHQLGSAALPDANNATAMVQAIQEARPIAASALRKLADQARQSCAELIACLGLEASLKAAPAD